MTEAVLFVGEQYLESRKAPASGTVMVWAGMAAAQIVFASAGLYMNLSMPPTIVHQI